MRRAKCWWGYGMVWCVTNIPPGQDLCGSGPAASPQLRPSGDEEPRLHHCHPHFFPLQLLKQTVLLDLQAFANKVLLLLLLLGSTLDLA